MKTLTKAFFLSIALFLGSIPAFGQTMLVTTTLSSATGNSATSVTGLTGSVSSIVVASATGISAPTPNGGNTYNYATSNAQSYLYVDRELMQVVAVSGTTITVIRGVGSTGASSHLSGALVFVVPQNGFNGGNARLGAPPQGSCTRTNELFLPNINFPSGTISDCLGGQWVNGDAAQTTRTTNYEYQFPPIGNVAYTSAGTSTAKATNTMYCTEFDLNYNKLITGLAVLNGASTGTDKLLVALYDSTGNLLANSATAGVVASGSSTFQKRAFTTPYFSVGPAQYFACAQGDSGTSATLNLLATGTEDFLLTKLYASQTFGTVPATITVPTTFTTLNGPIWFAY